MPDLTIALIDDKGTYKLISSQDEQSTLQLDKEQYREILQDKTKKQDHLIVNDSNGNEQLVVFHQIGDENRSFPRLPRTYSSKHKHCSDQRCSAEATADVLISIDARDGHWVVRLPACA